MRSVVVVFPASMWAMMPILRYRSSGVSRAIANHNPIQRKNGATDPDDSGGIAPRASGISWSADGGAPGAPHALYLRTGGEVEPHAVRFLGRLGGNGREETTADCFSTALPPYRPTPTTGNARRPGSPPPCGGCLPSS